MDATHDRAGTGPRTTSGRRRRSARAIPAAAFLLAAVAALPAPAFAQAGAAQIGIAQVDASALLSSQTVDVYVSVSDAAGRSSTGLGPESFSLSEGDAASGDLAPRSFELAEGVNAAEGIAFYLLVDNSGSMYDRLDGTKAASRDQTRMAAVRRAVSDFLNSADNPKDLIGLGSFNTRFDLGVPPTSVRGYVEEAMARIEEPARTEAYTELYAALAEAADLVGPRKGRKVVILLTDGENYPYARFEGKPHPVYGNKRFQAAESIEALEKAGVSVFPVHFGPARKDAALREIAAGTGGSVFDARDGAELAAAYREIRARVLREYRLRYRAGMLDGDARLVRVDLRSGGSATRRYFAGTIFRAPEGPLSPLLLVPLFVALALWFGLTRLRLLNGRTEANLEVLEGGLTKVYDLADGKTVVDVDAGAGGLTVAAAGSAPVPSGALTIVKGDDGGFTVACDRAVYVNNKPASGRRLEAGDVIRVGEATIVFDAPAAASATTAPRPSRAKGAARSKAARPTRTATKPRPPAGKD